MAQVTTLRDSTLELLKNRPISITLDEIADNCLVSKEWLKKFTNGRIKGGGVIAVETVYTFLKNHPNNQKA